MKMSLSKVLCRDRNTGDALRFQKSWISPRIRGLDRVLAHNDLQVNQTS